MRKKLLHLNPHFVTICLLMSQVRCRLRLHPWRHLRLLRPGQPPPHPPGPEAGAPGRVSAGARARHGAQLRRGPEQGEDLWHLHGGRPRQAQGGGQVSELNLGSSGIHYCHYRFGILPSCNHCFCLSCIRKWRNAKQFEHKIIRACPECRWATYNCKMGLVHDVNLFRQTSDYICPSRFWVETEEEKGRLLGDYRRNLGQKECKYFNKVGYWH